MKTKMFTMGLWLGLVVVAVVAFSVGLAVDDGALAATGGASMLLFGMATARASTNYTNYYVNKNLQGGATVVAEGLRTYKLPFSFTVASAAATGDTYQLTVIPNNCVVVDAFASTNGLGASAAAVTLTIGDSGDASRYLGSSNMGADDGIQRMLFDGSQYITTADTIVLATLTGTPVVGKIVTGWIEVCPLN